MKAVIFTVVSMFVLLIIIMLQSVENDNLRQKLKFEKARILGYQSILRHNKIPDQLSE